MNEKLYHKDPFVVPKSSPRLSLSHKKSTSIFVLSKHTLDRENERMRKDVAEKDAQIENFSAKVKISKDCSQGIRDLIMDLEESTGQEFLSKDQRETFEYMPHNQGILVIKKGMDYLIKEYDSLTDKYYSVFEEKAHKITDEIDQIEKSTRAIIMQRMDIQKELAQLDRVISIHKKEKDSLDQLAQSLQMQLDEQNDASKAEISARNAQLAKLRHEIQSTTMESMTQDTVNSNINQQLLLPVPKRHRDMLNDDKELEAEAAKLEKYLEKERREHALTRAALDHTLNEIARANETIMRYKVNVNSDTMRYATYVNTTMREYIKFQREEQKRKLLAQIKKNKDLERQINEMEEEKSMLIPYLAQVEKKLAAEMLKLPSLTDIQRRNEPEPKKSLVKVNRRELDDNEMRSVKRTITRIKQKRVRAKTAIGGR